MSVLNRSSKERTTCALSNLCELTCALNFVFAGIGQVGVMSPPGQQQRPGPGVMPVAQQKVDNLVTSQRPIIGSQQGSAIMGGPMGGQNIGQPPHLGQPQKTPPQMVPRPTGPPPPSPNLSRTTGAQIGAQMTGRVPIPGGMVRPGISPTTSNPMLMQRMVHPSVTMPSAGRGRLWNVQ